MDEEEVLATLILFAVEEIQMDFDSMKLAELSVAHRNLLPALPIQSLGLCYSENTNHRLPAIIFKHLDAFLLLIILNVTYLFLRVSSLLLC